MILDRAGTWKEVLAALNYYGPVAVDEASIIMPGGDRMIRWADNIWVTTGQDLEGSDTLVFGYRRDAVLWLREEDYSRIEVWTRTCGDFVLHGRAE